MLCVELMLFRVVMSVPGFIWAQPHRLEAAVQQAETSGRGL